MRKLNDRCGLRFSSEEREKIAELIHKGKFEGISALMRAALKKFLEEN